MIVSLFILCWMPYCMLEGLLRLTKQFGSWLRVTQLLYLLALLNSLIDPFIYALRMREVQRGWQRHFMLNSVY